MAKKILIADESDVQRALLQATLRDPEYEIIEASGGVQALALREKHNPDLVILDETMPGISGVEVCRVIKQHPKAGRTPVILLTTTALEGAQPPGANGCADVCLSKPFSPLKLLGMVDRLLGPREG